MEAIHTIRLMDPWEELESPEGCIHRRTFNAPTGITADDTLWIVIQSQKYPARLSCNGAVLGNVHRQACFEITALLSNKNKLEMLFPPGDPSPQRGSVYLEIRCPYK